MLENFIEKRKKLLEIFLIKTCALPFLYHSEEFQTFIRGPADFKKMSKDFKLDSFARIAEKYQQHFNKCTEKQESDDVDNQLEDSLKYFKMSLENLEKFEWASHESVWTFENYAKQTTQMLYGIREINNFYTEKYNVKEIDLKIREECTNPYQILLDWTQAELLDLKGIILAISKRQEIVKTKVRAAEKLEEEKKNLTNAQNGKKG